MIIKTVNKRHKGNPYAFFSIQLYLNVIGGGTNQPFSFVIRSTKGYFLCMKLSEHHDDIFIHCAIFLLKAIIRMRC